MDRRNFLGRLLSTGIAYPFVVLNDYHLKHLKESQNDRLKVYKRIIELFECTEASLHECKIYVYDILSNKYVLIPGFKKITRDISELTIKFECNDFEIFHNLNFNKAYLFNYHHKYTGSMNFHVNTHASRGDKVSMKYHVQLLEINLKG